MLQYNFSITTKFLVELLRIFVEIFITDVNNSLSVTTIYFYVINNKIIV